MRSILKIAAAVALFFGTGAVNAQIRDSALVQPPANTKVVTPDMKREDYVIVRNGIVRLNKIGSDINLVTTYECTDGSIVSKDGMLVRKDGTKVKLREGDKVYRDGRLETGQ